MYGSGGGGGGRVRGWWLFAHLSAASLYRVITYRLKVRFILPSRRVGNIINPSNPDRRQYRRRTRPQHDVLSLYLHSAMYTQHTERFSRTWFPGRFSCFSLSPIVRSLLWHTTVTTKTQRLKTIKLFYVAKWFSLFEFSTTPSLFSENLVCSVAHRNVEHFRLRTPAQYITILYRTSSNE